MKELKKKWIINKGRFLLLITTAMIISLISQIFVYSKFGGISGYILTYEQRIPDAFTGMGLIFIISESFPILAIIAFAYLAKESRFLSNWLFIVIAIVTFMGLQIIFGGLRGSRSNTVINLIWAIGIIHYWVRRIPKRLILLSLILILVFMYMYGFYKGLGSRAFDLLRGGVSLEYLEEKSGRDLEDLFLGDLARADIQAFLLYKIYKKDNDYKLTYGRSYIGDLSILIPKQIWRERPPTKVKEGTNALYGMNAYHPGSKTASNVYGLIGEGMLNFGIFIIPFLFLLMGYILSVIKKYISSVYEFDSRKIILAYFSIFPIILFVSDFDNVIFSLVKNLTLPFIVILFSSDKHKRKA